MRVNDNDKHASLLWFVIYHDPKKFYSTGPREQQPDIENFGDCKTYLRYEFSRNCLINCNL